MENSIKTGLTKAFNAAKASAKTLDNALNYAEGVPFNITLVAAWGTIGVITAASGYVVVPVCAGIIAGFKGSDAARGFKKYRVEKKNPNP